MQQIALFPLMNPASGTPGPSPEYTSSLHGVAAEGQAVSGDSAGFEAVLTSVTGAASEARESDNWSENAAFISLNGPSYHAGTRSGQMLFSADSGQQPSPNPYQTGQGLPPFSSSANYSASENQHQILALSSDSYHSDGRSLPEASLSDFPLNSTRANTGLALGLGDDGGEKRGEGLGKGLGEEGGSVSTQIKLTSNSQQASSPPGILADAMGRSVDTVVLAGINGSASEDSIASNGSVRPSIGVHGASGLNNFGTGEPTAGSIPSAVSAELQVWNQAVTRKEHGNGSRLDARNLDGLSRFSGLDKGELVNAQVVVNGVNGSLSQAAYSTSGTTQGMPGAGYFLSEGDSVFETQLEQVSIEKLIEGDAADGLDEGAHPKTSDTATTKVSGLDTRVTTGQSRQYASTLNAHVGDPEWGAELNQKIIWMSGRGIQSAELHLNPADLGPVEVRISVQNDQTVVNFNSQNAGVREMLESNVQRLRDMMDHNGVELADVSVDSGSADNNAFASKQEGSEGDAHDSGLASEAQGAENEDVLEIEQSLNGLGLVDYYA